MKTHLPSKMVLGCNEVTVHYKRPLFDRMIAIGNSNDLNGLLRKFIDERTMDLKEFFWVVLLSHANRVLGISKISSGTPKGVVVSFVEVFQLVLLTNASALAVAHNHPSGNLKPSESDRALTQNLHQLAKLFDVTFLDHLILTSEGYYSFSDQHLL